MKKNIFLIKSNIFKFNEPNPSYLILLIFSTINGGFFAIKLFLIILPKDIITFSLNFKSVFGFNKFSKLKSVGIYAL